MKKAISLLILLTMLLTAFATAEDIADLIPTMDLWGMSQKELVERSIVTLKPRFIGDTQSLLASDIEVDSFLMDCYYVFNGDMGTYTGLSKVVYVLKNAETMSNEALKMCYQVLVDGMKIVLEEPDSEKSSVTTWTKEKYTIDIGMAKVKQYTGSDNMTVVVQIKGTDLPKPVQIPDVKSKPQSVAPTAPQRAASLEDENALRSAQSYLKYTAFSYNGLIDQLKYEGYSDSACRYAADNCGANWKEQALSNAKKYLDYSAFSYKGLIDQLIYEKYTYEQAVYGADNCGANWKEQAAKKAKQYLAYSSFSRSRLIEQLEYEGFTHEQAEYGARQNGY